VRLYQAFPFDFAEYDFSWETLTRVVLVIAIVEIAISIIVETFGLPGAFVRPQDPGASRTGLPRPH
jgi:hypothetical protein